jgi:hypothetical protein
MASLAVRLPCATDYHGARLYRIAPLIFPMLERAAAADIAGMDGIRADDKNAEFENRSSRTRPELPVG